MFVVKTDCKTGGTLENQTDMDLAHFLPFVVTLRKVILVMAQKKVIQTFAETSCAVWGGLMKEIQAAAVGGIGLEGLASLVQFVVRMSFALLVHAVDV